MRHSSDCRLVLLGVPLLTTTLLGLACLPDPGADLSGPRITHSSLPVQGAVEVPVGASFVFELSEALDPATVHAGSVALVAWELLDDDCVHSPVCDAGSCVRGHCQRDPLTATQQGALARGAFDTDTAGPNWAELEFELGPGEGGPGTRLLLRPRSLLAAHRRYSLLLGSGLRDASGASLVDDFDRPLVWEAQLVTAGGGSSGPEPRLRVPASGQIEVATNLARVEVSLWPPVPVPAPGSAVTLVLEALGDDGGPPIELGSPEPCLVEQTLAGTCLSWRVASQLRANTHYRVAGGTLLDRLGRTAQRPGHARVTWFATGSVRDDAAPEAELRTRVSAGCLVFELDLAEPVEAAVQVADTQLYASLGGPGTLAIELDAAAREQLELEGELAWSVELGDLAGNHSAYTGSIASAASLDAQLPRLRMTEILANPAGPEPDAEFIEILAGPQGAALEGVMLSDLGPDALRAAYFAGELPAADALPSLSLAAGELALIVGEGWAPDAQLDGAPPLGTQVLRVEGSLAQGGLKNAGEALSLWVESAEGPVILHSYGNWVDTSASQFNGRSLVSTRDRCDLPGRWQPHPHGGAGPGVLP